MAAALLAAIVMTMGSARSMADEAYRLRPNELAGLTARDGKPLGELWEDKATWRALQRVFAAIGDGRKARYTIDNLSVFMTFDRLIRHQYGPAAGSGGGRIFAGQACRSSAGRCDEGAWLLADLWTGHVAVVLVHRFDAAGKALDSSRTTIFRMQCANAELQDAAKDIASQAMATLAIPGKPSGPPNAVLTRCK